MLNFLGEGGERRLDHSLYVQQTIILLAPAPHFTLTERCIIPLLAERSTRKQLSAIPKMFSLIH